MIQSFEEIKKAYPDEWLILGNPVMSEDGQKIIAAELLYHGHDKHELALRDKPLMKGRRFTIRYNQVTPLPQNAMAVSVRLVGHKKHYPDAKPIKSIYEE